MEKIAKEKGISVAELVRRIIDKELDRKQKTKKGEPRTEMVCVGCGRAQHLGKRKMVACDGYTGGFGGHGVKNPPFHLAAIPEGWVRRMVANGYHTRFATPEEPASVGRARDILKRGS